MMYRSYISIVELLFKLFYRGIYPVTKSFGIMRNISTIFASKTLYSNIMECIPRKVLAEMIRGLNSEIILQFPVFPDFLSEIFHNEEKINTL